MLHKEFDEKYNFWKLSCDEGEVISSWNEGDDILEYSSFISAFCPKDADLTIYHIFTSEQDAEYKKQREEEEKKRQPEVEEVVEEENNAE